MSWSTDWILPRWVDSVDSMCFSVRLSITGPVSPAPRRTRIIPYGVMLRAPAAHDLAVVATMVSVAASAYGVGRPATGDHTWRDVAVNLADALHDIPGRPRRQMAA